MEEKERYEYFFGTNTVKDNKTNQFYGCVVDLLNQQDKRIKELEEEIKKLVIVHFESEINKPVLTTTQIINQDKISFAIDELEKVKEFVNDIYGEYSASVITNFIDNQINELKEGK